MMTISHMRRLGVCGMVGGLIGVVSFLTMKPEPIFSASALEQLNADTLQDVERQTRLGRTVVMEDSNGQIIIVASNINGRKVEVAKLDDADLKN